MDPIAVLMLAAAEAIINKQESQLKQKQSQIKQQTETIMELGRQNIALAAEAERADIAERQLAAADARIRELEVALAASRLPAESRENVIQMVREAA